jgi:hypothetical protein
LRIDGMDDRMPALTDVVGKFVDLGIGELGARCAGAPVRRFFGSSSIEVIAARQWDRCRLRLSWASVA